MLTLFSILVNGYHFATDDGAIYLPAIIQRLRPSLYPANAQFIHAHSRFSIYDVVAAGVARCFGGSVEITVFVLHFVGIFVLLAAALGLAKEVFDSAASAWAAVCVLACTTSIFVAGTAIPIMDPYFTARTLSTPLTLVALSCVVRRKWLQAAAVLILAAGMHPLMALYATLLITGYGLAGTVMQATARTPMLATSIFLPGLGWGPVDGPARESMEMPSRHFFFAFKWSAAEWAGVVLPLAILGILWRIPIRATTPTLRRLCGGACLSGATATLIFLVISLSPKFEAIARLQPMRAFQLIYIVLFLVVGRLLGEYLLRGRPWQWALLLFALGAVDVAIDRVAYPASEHIEWPKASSRNPWVQAFDWTRVHTPKDALFALPPRYIDAGGEDRHGFRAIAERSSLADEIKDSGAVSMFPALASEWRRQLDAQAKWNTFSGGDFHRLAEQYPVTWVIVEVPQSRGLDCPYRNVTVAVCRIE